MNLLVRRGLGVFKDWTDGPWRSQTVLAAILVVAVGLGFWFSGIQGSITQNEPGNAATNTTAARIPDAAGHSTGSRWNWGKPFPFYVPMAASYVAGFCIGWFFRRLLRMVAVVAALLIGLLVIGRLASCDTTHTQAQMKQSRQWAQHELKATRDYLNSALPWTATGGIGAFLGFRRRGKTVSPQPASTPVDSV